ncbi:MAG TPA: methylglyoxal synthase [Casimicrobium sp.]|nr:methylglyoxal synthase [Burkholderiales bacterium]HPG62153.1 methylglyoxal synthase [Casimicrobium sp.]HPV22889.1 methylglyoxal synthase [Casimicrobium sp.]
MKAIALIAHDRCKQDMIAFARVHAPMLRQRALIATRTTGTLLERDAGLEVECVLSGPEGGDLQIGAQIAEGNIAAVIFLRDVLTSQPHEPDITALLRVCDVHNVPVATNLATAEMLVAALSALR